MAHQPQRWAGSAGAALWWTHGLFTALPGELVIDELIRRADRLMLSN